MAEEPKWKITGLLSWLQYLESAHWGWGQVTTIFTSGAGFGCWAWLKDLSGIVIALTVLVAATLTAAFIYFYQHTTTTKNTFVEVKFDGRRFIETDSNNVFKVDSQYHKDQSLLLVRVKEQAPQVADHIERTEWIDLVVVFSERIKHPLSNVKWYPLEGFHRPMLCDEIIEARFARLIFKDIPLECKLHIRFNR